MALALVRELQQATLQWQLHMLCPAPFAPLAALIVDQECVHPLPKGKWNQIKWVLKHGPKGFDKGLLLTNSSSSALIFSLCRVKETVGFKRFLGALLTHGVESIKTGHQVDRYKELLKPLGIQSQGLAPHVMLSRQAQALGRHKLNALGVTSTDKVLCIHASAIYGAAKCYPLAQHAQLIRSFLKGKRERYVVLVGTKAEKGSLEVLAQLDKRVINLAGKTDLVELCGVMKACHVMVANDSGPMHLADALSVPLIPLFGSSSADATAPYRQQERVVSVKGLACSPCFGRECQEGHFKCMKLIKPSSIVELIEQTLEQQVQGPLCLNS